jgi:hypothetical protein
MPLLKVSEKEMKLMFCAQTGNSNGISHLLQTGLYAE